MKANVVMQLVVRVCLVGGLALNLSFCISLSPTQCPQQHHTPDQPRKASFSSSSRRTFFRNVISVSTGCTTALGQLPFVARAADYEQQQRDGRPFAPVEALLPAARCKMWIDHAYKVGSPLSSSSADGHARVRTLAELNTVLSNRPKLFRSTDKPLARSSNRPTAQLTTGVSSANKEQFGRNRAGLSVPNKIAAALNQADVERQWGMLQSSEARREKNDGVRAALNYCTAQLEFSGDSYRLTAPREDRRRMIRNESLPTLTAVITSDLDLRDLYRNQLLTALDDWVAEVGYQSRRGVEEVEYADVMELMEQANTACTKWFDLIAPGDLQEALEIVRKE